MKRVLTPARGAIVAGLFGLVGLPALAQLNEAIQTGERATRQAAETQARINQLDDQRTDMRGEYRTLLQRLDAAKLFVLQQQRVVESQRRELESLNEQLGRVDEISAEMVPMMLDMIEDLELFVSADLPFKREIRQARLESLRSAMDAADVAPAEKYRLIIEAYQAEMEYGNTIDAFVETIEVDGQSTDVKMFQYGRVSLVYLNEKSGQVARFNRAAGAWETLPGSYRRPIEDAIRIAEGTKQQDVLFGPVEKYSVQ